MPPSAAIPTAEPSTAYTPRETQGRPAELVNGCPSTPLLQAWRTPRWATPYLQVVGHLHHTLGQGDGDSLLLQLPHPGLQLLFGQHLFKALKGLHVVGHEDDEAGELVGQGHLHDLQLLFLIVIVVVEAWEKSREGAGQAVGLRWARPQAPSDPHLGPPLYKALPVRCIIVTPTV